MKIFNIWYAVELYVNCLFTEIQRNSLKKSSKNLTFMLTRSQNFESTRSLYSRMRSDSMFSHQSPIKITFGSQLNMQCN